MIDIRSYQKLGYTGAAGEQTFWITLTNILIPALLIIPFLIGPAMIYKKLKLRALAEERKKLELVRQELKSEHSKLDDRIANLTAEENQAMRQANMIRLNEEKILIQVQIERKAEEEYLEKLRSESAEEKEKVAKAASELVSLKAQKMLFGG